MLGEGVGEEAFARGSGEDGQVELAELVKVGEERIVFVENFAETEAGIEDDLVERNAGGGGGFETPGEFGEDEGKHFFRGERREMRPFLRAAPGVHEDSSAVEFGAGGGHVGVPEVAADVVDDLGSGFDGKAGGGGMECVYREDGVRLLFQDGDDDGEDAGLLFCWGERSGVGAGGFAADVQDVSAFVEHLERLGEGTFGGLLGRVEVAAVGEGVGCDVEDAHDKGSPAERDSAGAEMPVVRAAGGEGHGGILEAGSGE